MSLAAIPIAYLLGAIPTAYIVGRLIGHIDLRIEGDGRISAAAIYWRLGAFPYLLVVCVDIGKAALAVFIASLLGAPLSVLLITGFITVTGHCWSVFMRFRGGLGATAICGTLLYLFPVQLLIGMAATSIFLFITRKTGLSSGIIIIVTSIVLLIQRQPWIMVIYPIILILIMVIKRFHVHKAAGFKKTKL
jgi:acyl phosphate:glycerol-3-phosphate acyltransferase